MAARVKVQPALPLQAPPQTVNTDPAAGVAASVTTVPDWKLLEQVAPQLIPAGALVTDPVPVPARPTVTVYRGTKFAPIVSFAVTVNVQAAVPAQTEPVHPVNTFPA